MYIYVVCIFSVLCNLAFGGCIELDQHIQKHILKDGAHKWGDSEIGEKASFDILRDINYLYYIEENCSEDRVLKQSKFYNDTWARVFGKAEKDSLENMVKKIYEKMANSTSIIQSQFNTLRYLDGLICTISEPVFLWLDEDTKQKLERLGYQKYAKTASRVVRKYTQAWALKEFSKEVDRATSDCSTPLEINGETVFSESERENLKNRNNLVKSVNNAWKEIESRLDIKLNNCFKKMITCGIVHKIENMVADGKLSIGLQSKEVDNFKNRLIDINNYYRGMYKFDKERDKSKPFVIFALGRCRTSVRRIDCVFFEKKELDEWKTPRVYRFLEINLEEVYGAESLHDIIEKMGFYLNESQTNNLFKCYGYINQEYASEDIYARWELF